MPTRTTPSLVPVCECAPPPAPKGSSPASSEIFSFMVRAFSRRFARWSGGSDVSHQGRARGSPQRPAAGALAAPARNTATAAAAATDHLTLRLILPRRGTIPGARLGHLTRPPEPAAAAAGVAGETSEQVRVRHVGRDGQRAGVAALDELGVDEHAVVAPVDVGQQPAVAVAPLGVVAKGHAPAVEQVLGL